MKAVSPSRCCAHRVHHVRAPLPLLHHAGNQLGGVLQVGVDHRHHVPLRVLEPRGERRLVAEVAREMDHPHAGVVGGEPVEQLGRGVGAAVVDEHELERVVGDRRAGALDERLDELLLVVDGGDDAQQGGDARCGCPACFLPKTAKLVK